MNERMFADMTSLEAEHMELADLRRSLGLDEGVAAHAEFHAERQRIHDGIMELAEKYPHVPRRRSVIQFSH